MKGLIKILIFVFCLFPYLNFGIFKQDTQPWALLFSFLLLIYNLIIEKYLLINKIYLYFLFSFFIAIVYFLFEINGRFYGPNFIYGLNSLLYYISAPIIILAITSNGLPSNYEKIIFKSFNIWFLLGLIHLFLPNFLTYLISNHRTSFNRGVTSFAPEPVWYARIIICFFLLFIILYWQNKISKNKIIYIFIATSFQIIFLSRSGTGFFYFTIILFIYLLIFFKNYVPIFLFLIFMILFVGIKYLNNLRLFSLIDIALNNPVLLTNYGGFNMRVLNAPLAIKVGLFENYGFGNGIINESNKYYTFNIFNINAYKNDSGRLNGGFVLFIYQIGFFSFLWLYAYFKILFNSLNLLRSQILFLFFSLFLIFFFEGSLSNPMIALLPCFILKINKNVN